MYQRHRESVSPVEMAGAIGRVARPRIYEMQRRFFFLSFLLTFLFLYFYFYLYFPSFPSSLAFFFIGLARSLVLIERTRRRFERYKSSLRTLRPLKGYRPGNIIQRIDGTTRSNAKGSVRAIPIIASNAVSTRDVVDAKIGVVESWQRLRKNLMKGSCVNCFTKFYQRDQVRGRKAKQGGTPSLRT